ncbi:Unknown protein [Striga hermonthica]|uniref:Uncharacterized protein n=1 Tax=Striga hermonthica TaxID=68872 RepID=A0A9N7NJC1_STRHE|nr:Unknown protein [Striga hermonthica]
MRLVLLLINPPSASLFTGNLLLPFALLHHLLCSTYQAFGILVTPNWCTVFGGVIDLAMVSETSVVDKLIRFGQSAQGKAQGLLVWLQKPNHRSPTEILKRLQREAFSDIMKLRDRQEKVERLLTYKSSKGSPFQEASTHVRGKVDVMGALFFMDGVDEHKYDAVQKSGIRTGIDTRLAFETGIRERDTLLAEFIASEKGRGGDISCGSLSLSKVLYKAHVTNWFSAIAVPLGAHCRDVGIPLSSHQEMGLTTYSECGPPLLNQENSSAIGITVRKSNVAASLAQFVSGIGLQVNSSGIGRALSTFGQVVWQLPKNTKLSLVGVHKEFKPSGQDLSLGALALPVNLFKRNRFSEALVEEDGPSDFGRRDSGGSIALMFNSDIDEGMRIGGWIEKRNSNPSNLQWAVGVCDTPEDEFGWGLSIGGSSCGLDSFLEHLQVESFLNLSFGGKFKLRPAVVYVKDGECQFPALMLRSSWSL